MIKAFIGWDAREDVAYQACKNSLYRNTSENVDVIALRHVELRRNGYFYRPWLTDARTGQRMDLIDGRPFSTEFSHTRFLVPALCDYEGWALFQDCDQLWLGDIKDLWGLRDDKYAVMCVKHNHNPVEEEKMDGQIQTRYSRKNWSSFVLFNCAHPANRALTTDVVNRETGTWLHNFSWLKDGEIGELPFEYNWIEDITPSHVIEPEVVHYTLGGPWFKEWQDVAYAKEWIDEYRRTINSHDGVMAL